MRFVDKASAICFRLLLLCPEVDGQGRSEQGLAEVDGCFTGNITPLGQQQQGNLCVAYQHMHALKSLITCLCICRALRPSV